MATAVLQSIKVTADAYDVAEKHHLDLGVPRIVIIAAAMRMFDRAAKSKQDDYIREVVRDRNTEPTAAVA